MLFGDFNRRLNPRGEPFKSIRKMCKFAGSITMPSAGACADTTRAIDQLNTILRLAPRDLSAYQHLFQIYRARGQRGKVITLLDSIVAMPGLIGSREKLFAADIYNRQRAFDKAARIYRDILKDDPNNADLHFKLGITHLSRGDTLSAEQNFRRIITRQNYRVTRETVPVWVQLVHIYSHEPYLNRLFEEPDTHLVNQLGNVLLRMVKGRHDHDEKMLFADMAERILNHQLQTDPENQTLLGIKARLLLDAQSHGRCAQNLPPRQLTG